MITFIIHSYIHLLLYGISKLHEAICVMSLHCCLAIFFNFMVVHSVYTAYTVRVLLLSSTPHRHLFSVNMLRQIHCTLPAQHDMAATINKPVAAEESQGQKWGSELVNSARFLLFYISVVNTKLVFLCSPVEYSNILYLLLPS